MPVTDKNQQYLAMMKDIYEVSARVGVKTYVWGGLAVDILHGEFSREHGDLDGFTENLTEHLAELTHRYEALGYTVHYLADFWMLQIKKGDIHAAFNAVRNIDQIAHWYHIGVRGTVFFPYEWLDAQPTDFYGSPVYTAGVRLLYALKHHVKLISAEWQPRDKDRADMELLGRMLAERGLDKDEIRQKIWSHNPFWYAQGYEEYYYPIRLNIQEN